MQSPRRLSISITSSRSLDSLSPVTQWTLTAGPVHYEGRPSVLSTLRLSRLTSGVLNGLRGCQSRSIACLCRSIARKSDGTIRMLIRQSLTSKLSTLCLSVLSNQRFPKASEVVSRVLLSVCVVSRLVRMMELLERS